MWFEETLVVPHQQFFSLSIDKFSFANEKANYKFLRMRMQGGITMES